MIHKCEYYYGSTFKLFLIILKKYQWSNLQSMINNQVFSFWKKCPLKYGLWVIWVLDTYPITHIGILYYEGYPSPITDIGISYEGYPSPITHIHFWRQKKSTSFNVTLTSFIIQQFLQFKNKDHHKYIIIIDIILDVWLLH